MKEKLESLVSEMYRSGILYEEAVREFKKRFIIRSLIENRGNQCKAARALGKHRNTLSRDIAELKIDLQQLFPRRNRRFAPLSAPDRPLERKYSPVSYVPKTLVPRKQA